MVVSNGSNSCSQLPALPSPARGSPPGASPNKIISAVTPELSGLERMLAGWRRQAARKTEQYRQIELDNEGKRQKEQQEINELRTRIIDARVKKLEQQQQSASKAGKTNISGLPLDPNMDLSRKRRSDDDYSGTSEGSFGCDSPASFTSDCGLPAQKTAKVQIGHEKSPAPEKNSSVYIETFQLQQPCAGNEASFRGPLQGKPISHWPVHNGDQGAVAASPYLAAGSTGSAPLPSSWSSAYAQQQYWTNYYHQQQRPQQQQASARPNTNFQYPMADVAQQRASMQTQRWYHEQQRVAALAAFRTQIRDVALPRHVEEEMIRSLPVNLDAALTPDFLRAIDDLD